MAKKILDPRANATKGVYEKFLRDKAAGKNTWGATQTPANTKFGSGANVGSSFYSPGGMKFGTDAYTPAMSTSQYVDAQAQGKANQPGLGDVDLAEVQRRIDAQNANAGANVTSSFYSPSGIKYGVDTPLPTMDEYAAGQAQAQANKAASAGPRDEWGRPLDYLPTDPDALAYLQGLDTQFGAAAGNTPAQKEMAIAEASLDAGLITQGAFDALVAQAGSGLGQMNINDQSVFEWDPTGTFIQTVGEGGLGAPPGGPPPGGGG